MSDRRFRVWIGPTADRTEEEITDLVDKITIQSRRQHRDDPIMPPVAKIRLNNADARFVADTATKVRISVEMTAPGRWNRVKARLRRYPGLRWLKVRTVMVPRYIGPIASWGQP